MNLLMPVVLILVFLQPLKLILKTVLRLKTNNVKTAIIEESRIVDSGISPAKQSCSLRDGKRGLQVSLRFDTAGALEDLRNHLKCP